MPYVNHYSFHIWDPEWGHITLKISGHPPFPAQVILNGHEYVACQARRKKIDFEKEGNCFTRITDAAGLAQIADTLSEERMIGRLTEVCERWIYTTCLCFALSLEEQQRSEFHYQYSVYQAEYSRKLAVSARSSDGAGIPGDGRPQSCTPGDRARQDSLGVQTTAHLSPQRQPVPALGS